jgi:hypothetical protein
VTAKSKRKRKLTLQGLIRFLIEGGENSLTVPFHLPEREALQRAVRGLGPCTQSLIGIIEGSGVPEHQRSLALIHLRSALAFAYTIGADGTMSENTQAAINSIRLRGAREARNKPRRESPENQIIRKEVERVGTECPPHKAIAIATNESQNVLAKHGYKLSYDAVRGRAARMLKSVRS